MKQSINLSETKLKKLIHESIMEIVSEMEYGNTADQYYAQKHQDSERAENERIKKEGKTIDLGPDWGVWRIQGGWAYPPKDCFIWDFGTLPFPDNYYSKPDNVIIDYIKKDIIERYQNAYRRR